MPKSYHSENAVVQLTSQLLESRGAGMVKFIWDSLELENRYIIKAQGLAIGTPFMA